MMNKREWMLHTAAAALSGGLGPIGSAEVASLSDTYDAIVAATPEPTDEGWIEHRGEKPYPEGMVEITQRNGWTDTGDADGFIWTHDDTSGDIIAWRPARD